MNIRDNATIRAPSGKDDVCVVFTIDTTDEPFVLQDIAEVGQKYTLSFYARSESSGGISVADKSMAVGVGWKRYVVTFVADGVDLPIYFTATGTYYLYNTQLEIGNKDTDFALNPADTEQSLDDLTVVVNNHSTQFSIMDGQISALIAEDATIRGEYDTLMSRTTVIEANLDGITSRVTLTEADISGVDRRLTEAESTIVQQAGEIALTVKEQDVTGDYIVGKLNLSSTTAKIAAKNIDLSGYVTVSSLKTAGSTNIDGSNITTGTISADRIDAESLMAKKLTATNLTVTENSVFSGTLNGATGSFSGAVTATSITAKNEYYIHASSGTGIKARALYAADGSIGNTLMVGDGFSTLHLCGLLVNKNSGQVSCGEDGSWGLMAGSLYTSGAIESNTTIRVRGVDVVKRIASGSDFAYNWRVTASGHLNPYTGSTSNPDVDTAGVVNIGNTSTYIKNLYYGGSLSKQSDRRLKNHIADLTEDEACMLLSGSVIHKFSYKADADNVVNYGVYAQELRDLLIRTGIGHSSLLGIDIKDSDGESTTDLFAPEEKVSYTVDYSQYAPILVAGWQNHHGRLLTLESRQDDQKVMIEYLLDENAALKKRVKELEKSIA